MNVSLTQLQTWLDTDENEHLEFKEAKERYDFEKLVKYCVALANEGGGTIILGITDQRPRRVVGSHAFADLERTKAGLIDRLHLRVEAAVIDHPDGRVLVFSIPSRPLGVPIHYQGAYWMRSGEDSTPMTSDLLKHILDEVGPDFSAEVCSRANFSDLASVAVEQFRSIWRRKSGNSALDSLAVEQLLADAELVVDGGITYAALILLGTPSALGKLLAQAETIFEYRSDEISGPAQKREEYRQGFFLFQGDLWQEINLRNDIQHFQYGFFLFDVPTFNEAAVREAVLNAVSHQDYRLAGSTFVRQFPRRLEVISPGGFPPGINEENILWRQSPRNRRIAEVFAKCGLVERSGQGINRMFEECIKESKPRPNFTGTDDYQVSLTLRGDVQDPQFLRFIEQVGREKLATFATQDFLALDYVHRDEQLPAVLKDRLPGLIDQGVIEVVGHGKGARYILSRSFYGFLGKKGVYTRKKGLDHETNKALLLQHIRDNRREGSKLTELMQVLPALSSSQVQGLLRSLQAQGKIAVQGRTKGALWFPGSGKDERI